MRKLMNKIDRFCYTHPRFGIPNLMLIIVIGNAAVWLLAQMDTTGQIVSLLSGSAQGILHGQVWRLITYVFVPTESRPIWLLLMLYFYYWIGSCLEREWGNGKFTIYYVSGMLLTAIYGVVLSAILGRDVIVSTTYLNLSMFFAFATLYPDVQVREARRIQREQANKPYHYKCAVCGRTDADHPELEFRYCSRCVGYHCFCQDHINNHIHFTE